MKRAWFLALLLALTSPVARAEEAQADDCARLSGVVVDSGLTSECRIATQVNASGAYNIATALRIMSTGQIVVPPVATGNSLTLNVAGALTFEVPTLAGAASIVGDTDVFGPNPGGIGASLTITATGDVVLRGDGSKGAIVSANSDPAGCTGNGKAGTIVIGSTLGQVTVENGGSIEASGQCPAGEISIVTDEGDIRIDGVVEAASGTSGSGGVTRPRGGPITISAACKLTIDKNGRVSSKGLSPGADLVHLESGCDTEILGRVESVAGVVPDGMPNRCTAPFRPDKPTNATACIEVWAGGKLVVTTITPNNGYVVAETGAGVSAALPGICCTWIDLFANGDVTIQGRPTSVRGQPYAIAARQTAANAKGGSIDVKSVKGKVTTSGRALVADAITAPGGTGGSITIEAGGPTTYPPNLVHPADPASNVDLGDTSVRAVGGAQITPPGRGSIAVRSFNGQITGGGLTNGAPDINKGHLDASGGGTAVVIDVRLCEGDLYIGPILPGATRSSLACGGNPTPPSFVDVPVFVPRPTVTISSPAGCQNFVCVFNAAPRPATALATGTQGEPLSPVNVTYAFNGNPVTVPLAVGDYVVTATFPGNANYRSASATAIVTVIGGNLPVPTLSVTGGTFTYDRAPHSATVTLLGNGLPLAGAIVTYNGSPAPPVNAGMYAVVASYAGSSLFLPAGPVQTTITINQATPVVSVSSFSALYDGNPHPASGLVTGVGGESLGAPTFTYSGSPSAPRFAIGSYTVVGTYAGSTNYSGATGTGTITLTPATPLVTVSHLTFLYDGQPHPATGSVIGVNGEVLSGLAFTYDNSPAAPTTRGVYPVTGAFTGGGNYGPATGVGSVTIVGLPVTVTVTGASVTYDGQPHPSTATVTDASNVVIAIVPLVYNDLDAGGSVPIPVDAGTYDVVASYPGDDVNAPAEGSAQTVIAPFTTQMTLTGGSFTYDGQAHPTVVTVTGVGGQPLSPVDVTYNGVPDPPVAVGTYTVVATFAATRNYAGVTRSATITIRALPATVSVTGGYFAFDGQPHPATGTVTGVSGEPLAPLTFTYNGLPDAPVNAGTYQVVGTFPGNDLYGPATATAVIRIVSGDEAGETCVLVDFREITYFRNQTVITSSDAGIRLRSGIGGPFNPALWPYDANGAAGKTRSRGTLFRIYGFKADQLGARIPDADNPLSYPVVADPNIPGAYYIDLGGKPARVTVCVPQLQTNLLDGSLDDAGVLPGSPRLTDAQKNVPGIMLTHNAVKLSIPSRVRTELRALGMPLVDQRGRDVAYGYIHYVGFQLWGHGNESLREFVDVRVEFVNDDATDRRLHYEYGFHTVKNDDFESPAGCNYMDRNPGNDGLRFNDVWEGTRVGDPDYGPACGAREPSQNQKVRENYAVPFNGVQLLTAVNTHDDTVRIFFGEIRPVPPANRAPALTSPGNRTVTVGSALTFTLQATDADGDALTYGATGLPAGGTLNAATGAFAWTPTSTQVGAFSMTFTVTDAGGLRDSRTVVLTAQRKRTGDKDSEPDDDERSHRQKTGERSRDDDDDRPASRKAGELSRDD